MADLPSSNVWRPRGPKHWVTAGYVQQPAATLIRLSDTLARFTGNGTMVAVIACPRNIA